jgi:Zinc knuckle
VEKIERSKKSQTDPSPTNRREQNIRKALSFPIPFQSKSIPKMSFHSHVHKPCFKCGEDDHTSKMCPENFVPCSACGADIDSRKPETSRNCLECGDLLCVNCVGQAHDYGCACTEVHPLTQEKIDAIRREVEEDEAAEAAENANDSEHSEDANSAMETD